MPTTNFIPVTTGDMVLVAIDPNNPQDWLPAIVERATGKQIVATAVFNGNLVHLEGCRHVTDDWWGREDAISIAYQEGMGMWKNTRFQEDYESLKQVAITALRQAPVQRTPDDPITPVSARPKKRQVEKVS